jgi:predicted RNase H-like nuclease
VLGERAERSVCNRTAARALIVKIELFVIFRSWREAMTPQRQSRLQKTHPELVFWHLNNKADLGNKKTDAGRRRRIALLKSYPAFGTSG